jgi:hypothetical protein
LDITTALAVGLGARAAAGLLARQAIQLGIQAAGGKLLSAIDLLPALPPVGIMGGLGNSLRPSFVLGDFSPVANLIILA